MLSYVILVPSVTNKRFGRHKQQSEPLKNIG